MNLKNGYKVMYEVIEGSERVFSASKTGLFADAEEIARFSIGSYKVVYQRGTEFFAIDAEGVETRLEAFDKIFVEATSGDSNSDIPSTQDPVIPEPTEPKEDETEATPEDPEESGSSMTEE